MTQVSIDLNYSSLKNRLVVIKSFIFLAETEEIPSRLLKLSAFKEKFDLKEILNLLEKEFYTDSVEAINRFLLANEQITLHVDEAVVSLKLDIVVLQAQIHVLSDEKVDLEKTVYEFNVKHRKELGDLISKILAIEKERAKGTVDEQAAQEQYNSYEKENEGFTNVVVPALSEEDQKEIKDKFRAGSKKCHPDTVKEENKAAAHELFAELSAAYRKNDLIRVREIFEQVKNEDYSLSGSTGETEKEKLLKSVKNFRRIIQELELEINEIKLSDPYLTISAISDWDEYFELLKQKFTAQLDYLKEI